MNNIPIKYLFLFLGVSGCSSVDASNKLEASKYLIEAQNCFSVDNQTSNDELNLPKDLSYKLSMFEADDYVDERIFKSGEILIHFQKIIDGTSISIELDIDPSQPESCSKISVHEILAET